MPRIRTIKPAFFRHEGLQDLESGSPGQFVMLTFAGLWGHCDKAGRFEWKPRTLKLDILPFLDFDLERTLATLEGGGFLRRYTAEGKAYGVIDSFAEHQRIGGKEAQEPPEFPDPPEDEKHSCSNGEATVKHLGLQEGKGREEEGKIPTPNGVGVASEKPAGVPPCPHEEILAAYHESCPTLPEVRGWNDSRKKLLQGRWRELFAAGKVHNREEGIAYFRKVFGYVNQSDFLCGRTRPAPGRDPFTADLEWLVRPNNFLKVIEGKYHPETRH